MNATTSSHNIVTGTQASSQPPSLAPSPALDADMAAVSSVSFGMSAAAAAGGSTTTEMEVEDTPAVTEATNPTNQQYLLHRTPTSPSTFNPAAWTGQIIGSGGIEQHPHPPPPAANNATMAQNQPAPTAAAAFSTPSLVRDGPPSVDADSNHLLRSATLYASPDLAALTAIATTTSTSTTTNNIVATPSTMTMMNAALTGPTHDMAANTSTHGLGYGYGFGYGYFTPSAANAPSSMSATTMNHVPTTTIDGRIIGAATSRDDLPPTGTTPPLPTPLPPASAHRHLRHPGMFAGTPIGDGAGISRSFFTPGGNFANLLAPSVEDTTGAAATATNVMGVSNPFGSSMTNYAPGAGQLQQVGQQLQQPRLNHPGAPFSLTVAAINASQMQVQPPTGLQMAAMAAASNDTTSADAAKAMSDTVAAAAIAEVEAEIEAEKKQKESSGATAKKTKATKKKRGGSTAGSKAKKPKTSRKPRPLPTAGNRPTTGTSAAAATTVPVGDGNTTGRYGSSRVSDGAPRPFTQEEKDATRCRCQKSRCLKLYCDCFQSGAECKDDCNCKSCGNTASNPKRQGIIDKILARKPEAFMLRAAPKTDVGCKCQKSRCLKLYCACFKAGTDCGDECICTDCGNVATGGEDDDAKPAAEPNGTLEAAPAATKPITPRDPPQMIDPAKAAEKVDVTPDSVYRPVISEQAAV